MVDCVQPVRAKARQSVIALAAAMLCLAALSPWASRADHQAPVSATSAPAAAKFTHGILWKIEPDGAAPSFLFGTIHLDDPRVLDLPPAVREAFDGSTSFTMETFFNAAGLVSMAQAMFFTNGQTLDRLLGKEDYTEIQQAVAARGLPIADLNKKKPWAVIMMLGAPRGRKFLFLDLMLQRNAVLAGKPNYKLETMAEQIAVFDQMPLENQARLLRETVRAHEQTEAQMATMTQAYLDRDLLRIMDILRQDNPENSPDYNSMMERLLTDRNKRMVERLEPRLREGGAFIAVGAGHLSGTEGMLHLLEQKGHRLTVLY